MKLPKDFMILIVDDEDDLREAIAFDFKRMGFRTAKAAGGHEARKIIETNKVDLVISDVHMAMGDGIELLDWVKSTNLILPVFIFVGSSMSLDLSPEEAYEKGAEAVFSKPFDRKELMAATINTLLPLEERFSGRITRSNVSAPVGIRFLKSDFSLETNIADIGRGGMFVALDGRMPEKSEEVEFHLHVSEPPLELIGSGIVRWVRSKSKEGWPSGCGIEFKDLHPASAEKLILFINSLKKKSFIPRA